MSADSGAELDTQVTLQAAEKHIPKGHLRDKNSTHPWINASVVELVRQKYAAEGTAQAQAANEACSAGMKQAYAEYIEKEKAV